MNDTKKAAAILRAEYGKSNNLLTPDVLEVGMVGPTVAYELSEGLGFKGEAIYGVSFVYQDPRTGKTRRSLHASGCCHSKREARNLINRARSILRRVK